MSSEDADDDDDEIDDDDETETGAPPRSARGWLNWLRRTIFG